MTWDAVFILAVAVMGLAIKPGAGMMMVMCRTLAQGMSACLTYALGFCIVSLVFLGLVIFGYKFADDIDVVFISIVVKSLAAVYLIWLGFKGLRDLQEEYQVKELKEENFVDNLTASIFLTLSNPLTIVFYAGVIPTILDVRSISFMDILIISIVICVVEFAVAIGYSLPLALYRYKLKPEFLSGLKHFSSIVIILVGLYIGYTALPAKDLTSVF